MIFFFSPPPFLNPQLPPFNEKATCVSHNSGKIIVYTFRLHLQLNVHTSPSCCATSSVMKRKAFLHVTDLNKHVCFFLLCSSLIWTWSCTTPKTKKQQFWYWPWFVLIIQEVTALSMCRTLRNLWDGRSAVSCGFHARRLCVFVFRCRTSILKHTRAAFTTLQTFPVISACWIICEALHA